MNGRGRYFVAAVGLQVRSLVARFLGLRTRRYACVDVARGIAFLAMFFYHACFFATMYGVAHFAMRDALFWVVLQKAIAGSFFALVGVSLRLAYGGGVRWRKYLLQVGRLLACALLITLVSALLFPRLIIWFGIIHSIALAMVVGLPFVRHPRLALAGAVVIFGLALGYASPLFDAPYLRWLGLGTTGIQTLDYQPFVPWFGVVLLGVAAGCRLERSALDRWRPLGPVSRTVAWLGQHTLLLYMLHVPLILLTLELLTRFSPPLLAPQ